MVIYYRPTRALVLAYGLHDYSYPILVMVEELSVARPSTTHLPQLPPHTEQLSNYLIA